MPFTSQVVQHKVVINYEKFPPPLREMGVVLHSFCAVYYSLLPIQCCMKHCTKQTLK